MTTTVDDFLSFPLLGLELLELLLGHVGLDGGQFGIHLEVGVADRPEQVLVLLEGLYDQRGEGVRDEGMLLKLRILIGEARKGVLSLKRMEQGVDARGGQSLQVLISLGLGAPLNFGTSAYGKAGLVRIISKMNITPCKFNSFFVKLK